MMIRLAGDHDRGFSLVELLVVITLLGFVGAATASVVISTQRAQQFTQQYREVLDDGRESIDRIRKELRSARRVYPDSDASTMRFWADDDQDDIQDSSEQICYVVEPLAEAGKYELIRWSGAETDCSTRGADARTIARTLVEPDGGVPQVFTYTPLPDADPRPPETRLVALSFHLDTNIVSDRGPDSITMEADVRLRNVA